MGQRTPRVACAQTTLVLALLLSPAPASTAPAFHRAPEVAEETPLAVAIRFARAFEQQDFATVRSLFTPDAMVSRLELARDGEPRFYRFSAKAWTDAAERNHVHLRDVRLEILDSATQSLELGAVVNLRYRFSGRAGERSFVSNGIDTYSLIEVGDSWRVLQYGYIERIEFF